MSQILLICILVLLVIIGKKLHWPPALLGGALAGVLLVFGIFRVATRDPADAPETLESWLAPDKAAAYRLGQAVKNKLPEGGSVLLIQFELPDPEPLFQQQPLARQEGLEQVLDNSYSIIRVNALELDQIHMDPETGLWNLRVRDYQALLEQHGPARAIVTFAGIPQDLRHLPRLGAPLFAFLDDTLSSAGIQKLPPGLEALVTLSPDHRPSDPFPSGSLKEAAETRYTLTLRTP
ncbi:hypothetical protein P0Y35_17570 [Kiritimatiellaeota bacterium B1221]|nr:hypothetical protein [Kiritimatiellaeota bacterium B1221]